VLAVRLAVNARRAVLVARSTIVPILALAELVQEGHRVGGLFRLGLRIDQIVIFISFTLPHQSILFSFLLHKQTSFPQRFNMVCSKWTIFNLSSDIAHYPPNYLHPLDCPSPPVLFHPPRSFSSPVVGRPSCSCRSRIPVISTAHKCLHIGDPLITGAPY